MNRAGKSPTGPNRRGIRRFITRRSPWGSPAIGQLTARMSVPVVEKHTLHPTLIRTPRGETVLDMGQNITGAFRFHADLPAGTKIRLQVGRTAAGRLLLPG